MRSLGLGQIVQSIPVDSNQGTLYMESFYGDFFLEDTSLYNSIDTSLGLPLEYYLLFWE